MKTVVIDYANSAYKSGIAGGKPVTIPARVSRFGPTQMHGVRSQSVDTVSFSDSDGEVVARRIDGHVRVEDVTIGVEIHSRECQRRVDVSLRRFPSIVVEVHDIDVWTGRVVLAFRARYVAKLQKVEARRISPAAVDCGPRVERL